VGWIATPQGSGALGGPQLQQVRGDLFRNYFRMLAADRYGYQVNLPTSDALELTGPNRLAARLRLDPGTGLPQGVTYEATHAAGSVVVQETYSDFREVAGIQVPFRISIQQGGRQFAQVEVKECKVNTGLKPEDLSARPRR
jgi:hypothetical protein